MTKENEDIKKDSPLDDESDETTFTNHNYYSTVSKESQDRLSEIYDGVANKSRDDFVDGLSQDALSTIIALYRDEKGNPLIHTASDLKALSDNDFTDAVNMTVNYYTYKDVDKERDNYLRKVQQSSDLELYAVDYTFRRFYAKTSKRTFGEFIKRMKKNKGENFYRTLADAVVKNYNKMVWILRTPKKDGGRGLDWNGKQSLTPIQAARIISVCEIIRMVCTPETIHSSTANGVVASYCEEGNAKGTYKPLGRGQIDVWAERLAGAVKKNWKNEFYEKVIDIASREENRVIENADQNLIFLKNCIFNYKTKERIDFSPEYIALKKFSVNLVDKKPPMPTHTKPNGKVLTLDECYHSYVPYEGGVESLKKLIGAVLRPKFNWRKMVTLYNATGNNGKSTILDHLKAIVGEDGTMTSSLSTLAGANEAGRFGLSNLVGVFLITCEDSDSGAYIRDNSRLKSIISHDTVAIERKVEAMFDYRPHALIVCAANDLPRTKDKGKPWVNRNIFIPFTGEFRGEEEDKSIREEWLVSDEVCEYIVYEVLMEMPYYDELVETPKALELKAVYEEDNDPVVEFYSECIKESPYDFIPLSMLWLAYQEWLPQNRPNTKSQARRDFYESINKAVSRDGIWMRPASSMRFNNWGELGEDRNPYNTNRFFMWIGENQIYTKPLDKVQGIVKTKLYDYYQQHGMNPKELKDQGIYKQVCEDLGLVAPKDYSDKVEAKERISKASGTGIFKLVDGKVVEIRNEDDDTGES